MNINRNNYEEYFLLYADNELSAAEKNRVEMFVQQNTDLEEEFIMLQQSVVKPDNTIRLHDKSFLLREESFINADNYEEKFLLYTDNELDTSEMELTEKFAHSNPAVQAEFNLLKKVTFEPDTSITFPYKSSLYKKEDKVREIPIFWKVLAAAVLLGIGFWTGINYLQNKRTEPEIVINPGTKPTEKFTKPAEDKTDQNNLVKGKEKAVEPLQLQVRRNEGEIIKQPEVLVKNIPPVNNEPNTPEVKKEDVAVIDPDKAQPARPAELTDPVKKASEPNNQNVDVHNNPPVNDYALQSSYIEDAQVKSENYVFYNITAEEFRKSKIGNFLKKVKRTIESKIPLKNNRLRIGNVEIAKDTEN